MRIWDVSPGYLSRQRLLGEHRELHGLYLILTENRRGYASHPETKRWVDAESGLISRHAQLASEMHLRGYIDRTPLTNGFPLSWPGTFVTEPSDQLALLRRKYAGVETGRIPLPRNAQQLWAHHKYSVMARDPDLYRQIGRAVARMTRRERYDELARTLTLMIRRPPGRRRLLNALEHMWGHVSDSATADEKRTAHASAAGMLRVTRQIAIRCRESFLLSSTALGDLGAYVHASEPAATRGAACGDAAAVLAVTSDVNVRHSWRS